MIGVLGHFALGVGLFGALVSCVVWIRVARGRDHERPAARQATWLSLLGAVAAAGVLEYALLTHDFSVRFVAENGSRSTPLYYTVTSLWSAQDGSLVLWLVVLAVYSVAVGRLVPARARHLQPWASALLAVTAGFFFLLVLTTGTAFDEVAPAPADGPGPNPLLTDHPAMGVHPPLLYAGYAGMAVPFAYAIAALVVGDADNGWLTATRRWTLVAWSFLTAGVVMGAWWSYAVLGWGGYWAWDPVENASLLPWLVGAALIHTGLVQRRRGSALRAWNVSLAASAFLLVLLGTFLTRTGAVASVHAFARSAIGLPLLGFFAVAVALVVGLLVWRGDRLGRTGAFGGIVSRESALLVNNVLLLVIAGTVLIGTLLPLLVVLIEGSSVSIGPPYFNRMVIPPALLLVTLMAVGPLVRWGADQPRRVLRRVAVPMVCGAVSIAALVAWGRGNVLSTLAIGIATMAGAAACSRLVSHAFQAARGHRRGSVGIAWSRFGAHLAHFGVAVAVVAITASSAYAAVAERRLSVGERIEAGGVAAELVAIGRERAGDTISTTARLVLIGESRTGESLSASLRYYVKHDLTVASPAIYGSTRDVYVTLIDVGDDGGQATVRLAINPLVRYLWAGGAMIAMGALIASVAALRRRVRPSGERQGPAVHDPGEVASVERSP